MNLNHERKPTTLLFNPFIYIAGAQALGLGLVAILLAGLLGYVSHTHFDGVLDIHTGAARPLWVFLSEGMIDWLCLSLALLMFGKLISRTPFRAIDVLGTQALARWPTVFLSLITLPKAFQRFGSYLVEQITRQGGKIEFNTADAIIFLAVVAAMIPLLCWMVALMYKSYSVSCNVKGGKAVGTFIGGIILAEVLSKLALYWLLVILPAPSALATSDAEKPSALAAQSWVSLIDDGNYSQSWKEAAASFQGAVKEKAWEDSMKKFRQPLGALVSRKVKTTQSATSPPGAPAGQYMLMQFETSFKEKNPAIETVTFVLEKDGKWKAAGFFIK